MLSGCKKRHPCAVFFILHCHWSAISAIFFKLKGLKSSSHKIYCQTKSLKVIFRKIQSQHVLFYPSEREKVLSFHRHEFGKEQTTLLAFVTQFSIRALSQKSPYAKMENLLSKHSLRCGKKSFRSLPRRRS